MSINHNQRISLPLQQNCHQIGDAGWLTRPSMPTTNIQNNRAPKLSATVTTLPQHINTFHQPTHYFPYVCDKTNQSVLIPAIKKFLCRNCILRRSATYRIGWVWFWVRLVDDDVVRPVVQHQVVLEHRENFKFDRSGRLGLSEQAAGISLLVSRCYSKSSPGSSGSQRC
jgi:hypothetical protein